MLQQGLWFLICKDAKMQKQFEIVHSSHGWIKSPVRCSYHPIPVKWLWLCSWPSTLLLFLHVFQAQFQFFLQFCQLFDIFTINSSSARVGFCCSQPRTLTITIAKYFQLYFLINIETIHLTQSPYTLSAKSKSKIYDLPLSTLPNFSSHSQAFWNPFYTLWLKRNCWSHKLIISPFLNPSMFSSCSWVKDQIPAWFCLYLLLLHQLNALLSVLQPH